MLRLLPLNSTMLFWSTHHLVNSYLFFFQPDKNDEQRQFTAPFFEECINEQDLDEMNIEIIRNTLYKSYLEAFYNFCKKIGGETEAVMCEILAVSPLEKVFLSASSSYSRLYFFKFCFTI